MMIENIKEKDIFWCFNGITRYHTGIAELDSASFRRMPHIVHRYDCISFSK